MKRLFGRSKKNTTTTTTTTTKDEGPTTRSRTQATANEGVSTRPRKSTTVERGKQKKDESSRSRDEFGSRPEDGFELTEEEHLERFRRLSELPHKQCRFQDLEAMNSMGITDNVLALAHNVGLAMLFQANHLAYKALKLEFLSTVEVERYNQVPTYMTFQLHNQQYTLTSDELSLLLGGPVRGAYLGNHTVDYHNTWGLIAPRENSSYMEFVPGSAKASSIRNPAF